MRVRRRVEDFMITCYKFLLQEYGGANVVKKGRSLCVTSLIAGIRCSKMHVRFK